MFLGFCCSFVIDRDFLLFALDDNDVMIIASEMKNNNNESSYSF